MGDINPENKTVGVWLKGPVENPKINEEGQIVRNENRVNSWEQSEQFEKGIVYYLKDEKVSLIDYFALCAFSPTS